ncbi:hypothetical protein AA0498_1484 [Acidomonas methanolica]|nr:hypothetical protein AA0498_1484 [Acidomonas methanolica]
MARFSARTILYAAKKEAGMLTDHEPIAHDVHVEALTIDGALPPELCGTLYRNGPNPAEGTKPAHRFLGAGRLTTRPLPPCP